MSIYAKKSTFLGSSALPSCALFISHWIAEPLAYTVLLKPYELAVISSCCQAYSSCHLIGRLTVGQSSDVASVFHRDISFLSLRQARVELPVPHFDILSSFHDIGEHKRLLDAHRSTHTPELAHYPELGCFCAGLHGACNVQWPDEGLPAESFCCRISWWRF